MLVKDLRQPSTLMKTLMDHLNSYRITYEGGKQFKSMAIQKKPQESVLLYNDKVNSIASLPICKSMITELNDIIFTEEPERQLSFLTLANTTLDTPTWIEDFLENADLQGTDFTDFMNAAATMAAVEGWCWVFADLPEDPHPNNRPYLTLIPAQRVIDWRSVSENGITIITYLKVIEYEDEFVQRFKVWEKGQPAGVDDEGGAFPETPTTATVYEVDLTTSATEAEIEEYFEFPSDYPIPVIQYTPTKNVMNPSIGISDLIDIADFQRQMLRLEAEAFDSIRFSKPLIRAGTDVKIPAGGGGIVRANKDEVEVFTIPVIDVQQIRDHQTQLIANFDAYTGRSGTRNIAETIQSGVSIVEERRTLHKKAMTRSKTIERLEEQVLTLICYMMGIQWAGDVEYNSDYEARDTQFKLSLLTQAKALSVNPVVQSIIDDEVIRLIAPPDELTDYLDKVAAARLDPVKDNMFENDNIKEDTTKESDSDMAA